VVLEVEGGRNWLPMFTSGFQSHLHPLVFTVVRSLSEYVCDVYLPVCLPVWLPACQSVCLPACVTTCLSVCLSVCLPACVSTCLSVCLSICLYVCLSGALRVCPAESYKRWWWLWLHDCMMFIWWWSPFYYSSAFYESLLSLFLCLSLSVSASACLSVSISVSVSLYGIQKAVILYFMRHLILSIAVKFRKPLSCQEYPFMAKWLASTLPLCTFMGLCLCAFCVHECTHVDVMYTRVCVWHFLHQLSTILLPHHFTPC
jgi:hypothetical protein